MPAQLTGILQADFSAFYEAVTQAETHLTDFEKDANKVEKSLQRMSDAFSGKELIRDATLMVEAVDRLDGGVKALTDKELVRLNQVVGEASEKLRAMGKDVPGTFSKITEETKNATGAFGGLSAGLTEVAGALGVTFSITSL